MAGVKSRNERPQSVAGLLGVGATPSLSTAVLPKLLTSFHRNHPGVTLEIAEAGSRVLVPRVAAGDIDVALVVLPVDDERLDSTELFTEPLVVVLASIFHASR